MISADVKSEEFRSDARIDPWDLSMVVVISYVCGIRGMAGPVVDVPGIPARGCLG